MKLVLSGYLICLLCFYVQGNGPNVNNLGLKPCKPRKYGETSTVCVCTGTYCDEIEPVGNIASNQAAIYQTTQAGDRMLRSLMNWEAQDHAGTLGGNSMVAKVNPNEQYQEIFGFGGAFTDAAGINIKSLSKAAQQKLMESYFSSKGLEYTVGRIPMASCDFSTHEYSYDDVANDMQLVHFALTMEDTTYKIPFIKQAQMLSGNKVRLFGSPWSPPGWMKTSGIMHSNGTVKGQPGGPYYKSWAQYFVKFLQAYRTQNVTIWGLTGQNEPMSGFIPGYNWQTCGFTPEMQRDFIKMDLGPALVSAGYENIKLMIMDDQRIELPHWAQVVLKDKEAAKYISGIAVHWYWDKLFPSAVLNKTHELFPDYFVLGTEACTGEGFGMGNGPSLGNWNRGQQYVHDIIQDLNNYMVGWTDWNLALDLIGGPNWVQNYVDAPIIVNKTADEFYKQPMFYAMAHFSKFLPPGSVRIGLQLTPPEPLFAVISATAFRTPVGDRVMIILNSDSEDREMTISETQRSDNLKVTAKSQSFTTVIWKKK